MAAARCRIGRGYLDFSRQSGRGDLRNNEADALLRAPPKYPAGAAGPRGPLLALSPAAGVTPGCCAIAGRPPRPPRWGRRAFSSQGPRAEPLYRTRTGYYEVLGVSPAATQAQIKTAYYRQSFLLHPDRNDGAAAAARFSDVSEAYAVLGSKALRKKYDRGLLSPADLTGAAGPSSRDAPGGGGGAGGQGGGGGRGGGVGRSVVGAGGKGYNFDQFVKSHYQEQLRREKELRLRREEVLKRQAESAGARMGWLVEMGVGVMVALAAVLLASNKAR